MSEQRRRLRSILRGYGSVVVGYSGGVDSVFLAMLCVRELGRDQVVAVTGRSASLPVWADRTARAVARDFGIPWLEVDTREMDDPRYTANGADRCYHCKSELWDRLFEVARERGMAVVLDGSNADDAGDHRPGLRAARERGVRSPLLEAGVGKDEIRAWSREIGLPTWDQPASPCLSSRLPYGVAVTPERLAQVERAELVLREIGIATVRVRHHDPVARLEVEPGDRPLVLARRREIVAAFRAIGFRRVLLDIAGYRRGALNEGLAAPAVVQIGSLAGAANA